MRIEFALIALLLFPPAYSAHPTEADPYCEPAYDDHPEQGSMKFLGEAWAIDQPAGDPVVRTRNCEGEHWDGNDPSAEFANNRDGSLTECTSQSTDLDGLTLDHVAQNMAMWQCSEPSNSPSHTTRPTGVRSRIYSDTYYANESSVYASGHAYLVGDLAIYAEYCRSGDSFAPVTSSGRHEIPCGARTGTWPQAGNLALTGAVYYREQLPLLPFFTAARALRIFDGYPDMGDCTQARYMSASEHWSDCGRSNTAITIGVLA